MEHDLDRSSERGACLVLSGDAERDGGYVLALVGLLLVPLLLMTAFAVDVGAWYAQGTKMQRAADNASMAGVVWLPDETKAAQVATAVMVSNGFNVTCSEGGSICDIDYPGDRQMKVSVQQPAKRYFSQVVMKSTQSLTRAGTATFIAPIPLGSPTNKLGNDVASCPQFQPTTACGSMPMLWSAIQGPYQTHSDGDPYTTFCRTGVSGSSCGTAAAPSNTDYKPDGYQFAIDVPPASVGTAITVEIWDAIEVGRTTGNSTSTADCRSGLAPWVSGFPTDFGATNCQAGDQGPTDSNGLNMQFELFDNDGSDLTVTYNTSLCEKFIPADTAANAYSLTTYKNKWSTLCTFTPSKSGIYPLRVKSSNITLTNAFTAPGGSGWTSKAAGSVIPSSTDEDGWNAYSLKLTTAGAARLYNLNNISIWTNTPGSTARFYLAEIKPEHKGKKIVLDLFDPGDGQSGTYTLQVLAPPTASPYNVSPSVIVPPTNGLVVPDAGNAKVTSCKANTTGSTNQGGGTLTTATNCTVTTRDSSGQKFQNGWLRYEIALAATYNCTTDCWWTIKYDFGSSGLPNDRTVWSLAIIGDPVHLID